MLHFSNQELAKSYHVSVRTVRNWIEAAKSSKLDLTLHDVGKRTYVANTSKNIQIIEGLVLKGKKYRPHRSQRTVVPQPKFYDLYTQEQIYDIVSNLEIHHEVPLQYSYFDDGAEYWDNYANRLAEEESQNILRASIKLLATNTGYLDDLLHSYKYVNVIDVGIGNAYPAKDLLRHLLDQNKLSRYIGIDISSAMLGYARKNINKWFKDEVKFEGYERDINYDRFTSIVAEEHIKKDSNDTINVVLFFGGTPCNFRSPNNAFRVIHDSMGANDILIHQQKLDSAATRRYFDFNVDPAKTSLATNHRLMFDLLNVDATLYDVEMGFDEKRSERYIRIRLKVALTIRFDFENGKRLVNLNKDDAILVWRYKQQSALDALNLLDQSDFYPLHSSQTEDQEYILTISRIKHDPQPPS